MRILIVLSVLCLGTLSGMAQFTWSEDIAPILYDHCVHCHREGQIGPFPLYTYEEALAYDDEISEQVVTGTMPPWPANPEYRHFAYENLLTEEEKQKIALWVAAGSPEGDPDLAPGPPVYNEGSQLDEVDMVLEMEPYTLQYNTDEYRWFTIENPFEETIYVNAIEVIPGLPEFVHHADLSYDMSGDSHYYDNLDPLSGFNGNTGSPNYDYYMNAWMAGGNVMQYPDGWGIEVLPGAYFVFEVHYGAGGQGQVDHTRMNLKLVDNPQDVRPVYASWLMNGAEEGGSFIPANEVSWYTQQSGVFWSERSLLTICPHQHMLGDSYRVWLETAEGDSIPLIDIPHWDFHWQMYYTFLYPQHVPVGSRVRAEASYDNTESNEHNPNDPPEHVYWGPNTTDEMMMVFSTWSPYMEGDENLLMDSTYVVSASSLTQEIELSVYPNPADDHFYIKSVPGIAEVSLTDINGRIIWTEIGLGPVRRISCETLCQGIYNLCLKTSECASISKRVVIQ
ncbi:MAG: T9SS type A sorting domain-containing protein [Flavobacteriales bacterium]|nr:T9SS type A sorting domain-containing protein [Flavobacteriales bacterium]